MAAEDGVFWKSWATVEPGLIRLLQLLVLPAVVVGKRDRLVMRGLSIAGVDLEMSSFMSELFSLRLLQEPSVSLFRFIDSVGSLFFSANI